MVMYNYSPPMMFFFYVSMIDCLMGHITVLLCWWVGTLLLLGIGGQGGMKLTCGIIAAGKKAKLGREDKVCKILI